MKDRNSFDGIVEENQRKQRAFEEEQKGDK